MGWGGGGKQDPGPGIVIHMVAVRSRMSWTHGFKEEITKCSPVTRVGLDLDDVYNQYMCWNSEADRGSEPIFTIRVRGGGGWGWVLKSRIVFVTRLERGNFIIVGLLYRLRIRMVLFGLVWLRCSSLSLCWWPCSVSKSFGSL